MSNKGRGNGKGIGIVSFGIAFLLFSSVFRGVFGHVGIFGFLLGIGVGLGVAKLVKTLASGLDTTTHNREDTQHTVYTYQKPGAENPVQKAPASGSTVQPQQQPVYQYQKQGKPVGAPAAPEEPESLKKVRTDTGNPEVDALLKSGREMIREIRSENEQIPDSALTEKLNLLENRCSEIFRAVYEKPSKAHQIRKFMDYYLPTTLKMVKAYRILETRGISDKQMETAHARIDSALGVVVDGTQKILDSLYQEDVLDITTDIDVLEQMLKRDGLTESDLEKAAQQAREAARIDEAAARANRERAAAKATQIQENGGNVSYEGGQAFQRKP